MRNIAVELKMPYALERPMFLVVSISTFVPSVPIVPVIPITTPVEDSIDLHGALAQMRQERDN